jgi:3-hydroxyisobutyrate dehydrogenase
MSTIAFIGLGNMGGPMAANLVKAGHAVIGSDLSADAVKRLEAVGGKGASSLADAVKNADVVVTMLPSGKEVRFLYGGENGIIANAKAGALFLDCSTIDVDSARAVAADAETKGLTLLDCPVSGGVGGAAAGTLTFMVGGTDEAFARAKPYLEAMGKKIVLCGTVGAGQAAKICNNMILGISMIAVSEAFVLAEKLGLSHQALYDVASTASGQCWSLTTYCPVPGPVPTSPANRDYQAGFTAAMMLKDLKLSQEAARSSGAVTPMGAEATALYGLYAGQGEAAKDFSGIIEFLRGK